MRKTKGQEQTSSHHESQECIKKKETEISAE
jgi:hypothetical protein